MSSEIALLGQILNLASDENVRIDEFGSVVASSPQLAAQVLKVANSALYGMEGRITRLERAVVILGVPTVASIASSVLIANRTRGVQIGKLSGDALWLHSLEVGCGAQLISRCLSWPHDAEAYLAGLLHELGIVELAQEYGPEYCALVDRVTEAESSPETNLLTLELELCGETHGQRLARISKRWGFPTILCDSFSFHHAPTDAAEPAHAVASLVHAAHILTDGHSDGWSDHIHAPEEDQSFLDALGLGSEEIADVRTTLSEQIKELSQAYA